MISRLGDYSMEWLTQLNPTILITAIILNSAGLIYSLWILRQQNKETHKLIVNHIAHNTEVMSELKESVKENSIFTKATNELIKKILTTKKKRLSGK